MEGNTGRLNTALADRYQIEGELGHGGMATVYLAHDVRHNRKVALKVLRPELAAMIGADRFLKEIEVTANLQHPHILPLHDSGEADSFLYYVMPYVEGETLRNRLDSQKQLGIEEAVEITRSVASALDYAHRHGVIHRDIKPENVLLHDGQAMVADFGIALAVSHAGGHRLTETGLSLGTPHYMSPEQAMGDRELDARSDVYSLGAMLYEMLAGDPPYTGSTAQAIVAKVITEKPALVTIARDTVPSHVAAAVHKALAKLPADRFKTAHEFAEALARPGTLALPLDAIETSRPASMRARIRLAGLVLIPALGGAALGWLAREAPKAPETRVLLDLRLGDGLNGFAISRDGSALALNADDSVGRSRLYVKRLGDVEPREVAGSEGTLVFDFSPDGRELLCLTPPYTFSRIAANGGVSTPLIEGIGVGGAVWGDKGNVYFVNRDGQLARIPAHGGTPEVLLANGSSALVRWVLTGGLPNERGLLLSTFKINGVPVVSVLDLSKRGGDPKPLVDGAGAQYVDPGQLLYVAGGTLYHVPFDPDRLEITGAPEVLALNVPAGQGYAGFTASRNGNLFYLAGREALDQGRLVALVSRDGHARPLPIPTGPYQALSLSPDGRRVATETVSGSEDGGDVITFGLGDSVVSRLTFQGVNRYPTWTADGKRLAFSQLKDGERDLVWKPADGSGAEEKLLARPGPQFEVTFSPDGKWMIYREGDGSDPSSKLTLRYRSLAPGGLDTVFLVSPAALYAPALSPDGRWLAYTSDSGSTNIFVRPFPPDGSGAVWQVSTRGGSEPVWSRSGRELYFKEAGWLVAAEVRTTPTFQVVARRRLFSLGQYHSSPFHQRYAALKGDSLFLMVRQQGASEAPSFVLLLNWAPAQR